MGDGGNCGGMAAKNVGDGDGYKRMEESCRGEDGGGVLRVEVAMGG